MGCRKLTYYEDQEAGVIKPLLLKNTDTLSKKEVSEKKRYDYYPFGGTFNSFRREDKLANKFKFQGQEHDELTGWDQFKWRNHQPDIGRFFNIDPLAESYVYNSPYAFAENKLGMGIELEGLELAEAFTSFVITMKANSVGNNQKISNVIMDNNKSNPHIPKSSSAAMRLSDAGSVSDNVSKNINEVQKVALTGAKVVGTVLEFTPAAPIGIAINVVAEGLDQKRQVAFEGKDANAAKMDGAIDATISLVAGGLGKKARTATAKADPVKAKEGAYKVFNNTIDAVTKMFETAGKEVKQKVDENKVQDEQ